MTKSYRILLSNDDGHFAPGILSLYHQLKTKHEVKVVAPLEERSTTGHTLSLHQALRAEQIADDIFGISGFPADCVYWALSELYANSPPDVVISGINRGANMGQDVYYSGTVAAAREAIVQKVPAMAISTAIDFQRPSQAQHYQTAAQFVDYLIEKGSVPHLSAQSVLNVNIPNYPWQDIRGAKWAKLGLRHYPMRVEKRVDPRQNDYYWLGGHYQGHDGDPSTDNALIDEGLIALTPLPLLLEHAPINQDLSKIIEGFNNSENRLRTINKLGA